MDLLLQSDVLISDCGLWRYHLDRQGQESGIMIAYFGVNFLPAGPTAAPDGNASEMVRDPYRLDSHNADQYK